MSKIIAQHPTLGRKEFSINVWETMQKWPNNGGWQQVKEQPTEGLLAGSDPEEAAPVTTRRKAPKA